MAQFISDADMDQLHKEGKAQATPQGVPLMKFISDSDMEKMGQDVPQAETAVRNLAQGFTLGHSDELAGVGEALGRAVGLKGAGGPMRDISVDDSGPTISLDKLKSAYVAGRDAERAALKKDQQQNPKTAMVANLAGGVLSPVNKLKALEGMSLAKQGALLGAITGEGTSEQNNLAGIAADTAVGGVTGAAVGKALDAGGKLLSKGVEKGGDVLASAKSRLAGSQAQEAEASAAGGARAGANISVGPQESEMSGEFFKVKPPENIEELRAWQPKGSNGALPGKERLSQIVQEVPDLETQPLKLHYEMMNNPKAMKELKIKFENLPTADAKKLAAYNLEMVNESERKIGDTVKGLAGGQDPKPLTDAGYDFINTVKDKYSAEKEALSPVFEQLQNGAGKVTKQDAGDLIQAIGANSRVGKLLDVNPEGKFYLKPNAPRSGISDAEHGVLSRVIDDLNDGMSFQEIQRSREFLRKAIDPKNPGASEEISKVRSVLLGQLEELAKKNGPEVGETFKKYAVNERARESIEKIIGGKVESLDAMFAANPDRVVQKIFSNPNHAKIVGEYVGPEKLQELAASYIQKGLDKATDQAKGFQPHVFRNWLKSNDNFVKSNLPPEVADRLHALADYGWYGRRFLDEVNPSGTAASILGGIQSGGFKAKLKHGDITGAVFGEALSKASSALTQRQSIKSINEALGSTPQASRFSPTKLIQNSSDAIEQGATRGGAIGAANKIVQGVESLRPVADKDQKKEQAPAMRPLKGKEKWASDGLQKAIDSSDPETKAIIEKNKGALLSNKKAKELLVMASDLKPGSKAMSRMVAAIKLHANSSGA
jgi:hypothetical protein